MRNFRTGSPAGSETVRFKVPARVILRANETETREGDKKRTILRSEFLLWYHTTLYTTSLPRTIICRSFYIIGVEKTKEKDKAFFSPPSKNALSRIGIGKGKKKKTTQ